MLIYWRVIGFLMDPSGISKHRKWPTVIDETNILWMDEILHQLIDGQNPIIYRVSTILLVV